MHDVSISYYPPDCPPQPFDEHPGTYFRMIKEKNGPRPKDFHSPFERKMNKEMEASNPCGRRGISIFSRIDDAKMVILQTPSFPYRYIIKLKLTGGHGVILPSPINENSHADWWLPVGVTPLSFCTNSIEGPIVGRTLDD